MALVEVTKLVPGSVIASMSVTFPSGETAMTDAEAFKAKLLADRGIAVFSKTEMTGYGRPGEIDPDTVQLQFFAPPSPPPQQPSPPPPPPPPPPPSPLRTELTFTTKFSQPSILVSPRAKIVAAEERWDVFQQWGGGCG